MAVKTDCQDHGVYSRLGQKEGLMLPILEPLNYSNYRAGLNFGNTIKPFYLYFSS